ncbi:hypothetical protein [Streptomyces sp. S465]|uniref:hypothetical protein n=1 Tax=Streptomyces sp. S465 TaxID=2979468 RepID=UPI0022A899DE|nr:hypothetical protein [Streptomyces sp. S465]WAP59097.1 hypothetical protein N6H00_31355 [Streptomyces sp. S465]
MPASLRPDTPIGIKYADDTWQAISTANDWGRCVLDALGDHTGAVLEDTALRHLVWFVPPGGVDGWPTPEPLRLTLYRAGDSLLVPRLNGYRGVNVWLRTPKANGLFTDPNTLRLGYGKPGRAAGSGSGTKPRGGVPLLRHPHA